MKTVLSCCTAKVFAQALLPMATMSPPPQAAAGNDNKVRSVSRSAWPGPQDCSTITQEISAAYPRFESLKVGQCTPR